MSRNSMDFSYNAMLQLDTLDTHCFKLNSLDYQLWDVPKQIWGDFCATARQTLTDTS